MLAQGASIVNADYFAALQRQAAAISSCADLQVFADTALPSLDASIAAITQQLAALQPMLALLTAPGADPSAIVTWITDFITAFVTPYVKPVAVYTAQLVALTAAIADLQATIQSRAAAMPSCSITLPGGG